MKNFTRRIILSGLSFAALLGAGAILAQDLPIGPKYPVGGGCHCSNPVNINIVKNSGASNPDPADFQPVHLTNNAPYNSPMANKFFAETIRWRLPTRTCELTGKVSYTVKNVANSSLQSNDTTALMVGGSSQPGTSQLIQLPVGQSHTYSYPLTSAQLLAGKVSIFVQDDTSVTNVQVTITGCCIKPM
jgi:hypothetical protein